MHIKTADLTGAALDWAVAKCVPNTVQWRDGRPFGLHYDSNYGDRPPFEPSTDWAYGGPLIEWEGIQINFMRYDRPPYWTAHAEDHNKARTGAWGPTPLVAAMRAFVASRLGAEVDIPNELLED